MNKKGLRTTAQKVYAMVNSSYECYTEHCQVTEVLDTSFYIMFLESALSPFDCHYTDKPYVITFFYFKNSGDC
jgi:hypothetical protein